MDIETLTEQAWQMAQQCRTRKLHVSLIVRDKTVVSAGTNGFEIPLRYAHMGYRSLHSEAAAMIRYRGQKDGLELYNFRFNRSGEMRMAKPCSICLPWCESVFDSITWTTNQGLERWYNDEY